MKNICKQIFSMWMHEIKLVLEEEVVQHEGVNYFRKHMFWNLNLSLQHVDILVMPIIDEGGDDIVLGIFDYLFALQNSTMTYQVFREITKLLFLILEGLAKQKEGEAIIIKHIHVLLRFFNSVYDFHTPFHTPMRSFDMRVGVRNLVRHKGIAQALITQEGVELLVGALE
jgi:hypothetical protein